MEKTKESAARHAMESLYWAIKENKPIDIVDSYERLRELFGIGEARKLKVNALLWAEQISRKGGT